MANHQGHTEISVLLADRVPLFSSGLQQILMAGKGFSRVDVAEGRKEVMQYLQAFKYDILLMDTRLNDSESLEILQQIKRLHSHQKVIFIGKMRDNRYLRDCIQQGLKGFIIRSSSLEEVIAAFQLVKNNGEYFSADVARALYRLAADPIAAEAEGQTMLLSRELEVLRRICEEKCNEEIAAELTISVSMVKKYRSSLLSKTGAKNTVGLVLFAVRHGVTRL